MRIISAWNGTTGILDLCASIHFSIISSLLRIQVRKSIVSGPTFLPASWKCKWTLMNSLNWKNNSLFPLVEFLTLVLILSIVLYGCETWSLILREECRLSVYKKRIVMLIFLPRGMRMRSGLYNELHSLHRSPKIVRFI